MAQTDRQTDKGKSSRWQFTAYEDQWPLIDDLDKSSTIAEYGYQHEVCPDTGRKHRQGYIRTKVQVRFSALKKEFPGVHFEVARNWDALVNYCKKEETRDKSQPNFFSGTGSKEVPLTMAQALMKLASYAYPYPVLDAVPVLNEKTGKTELLQEWNGEYDAKIMYKYAVQTWIKINPNIIALITQPQYKSTFYDFWKDFMYMAIETFEFEDESNSEHSITRGVYYDEDLKEFLDVVEPPEEDFSEYSFLD